MLITSTHQAKEWGRVSAEQKRWIYNELRFADASLKAVCSHLLDCICISAANECERERKRRNAMQLIVRSTSKQLSSMLIRNLYLKKENTIQFVKLMDLKRGKMQTILHLNKYSHNKNGHYEQSNQSHWQWQ